MPQGKSRFCLDNGKCGRGAEEEKEEKEEEQLGTGRGGGEQKGPVDRRDQSNGKAIACCAALCCAACPGYEDAGLGWAAVGMRRRRPSLPYLTDTLGFNRGRGNDVTSIRTSDQSGGLGASFCRTQTTDCHLFFFSR
jgi:hypothetical protein